MKIRLILLFLLSLLSSCAPTVKWTKPNFNQAVYDYDYGNCKTEAEASIPPVTNNNTSRLFAGFSSPEEDERDAKVVEAISGCMRRKGYYLQ
jgi:hypothetical protein